MRSMVDERPSARLDAVRVHASARVHLGFLDLNGSLGRRFGSLGLALDEPSLDLSIAHAPDLSVSGSGGERWTSTVRAAASHLGTSDRVVVRVNRSIPSHAGFGSGTQLSLAVAAGMARLFGKPFDAAAAAMALDRGNRSGIGLATFCTGGFVLDGGRDGTDRPPPVLARHDFPSAWRVLLILDDRVTGVHGGAETSAFQALPPFPEELAAQLCRIAMMQILPSLVLQDFDPFSRGIGALQRVVGDYFAPFQGGGRYTSPQVGDALSRLEREGVAGIGQSSWGPTGFALFSGEAEARRVYDRLGSSNPDLKLILARGRNRGAEVFASEGLDSQ